jgi:hypothetical protein
MNPTQERFFDEGYNQTLVKLGFNPENEKLAFGLNTLKNWAMGLPGSIRRAVNPGKQMTKDVARQAKHVEANPFYESDPMKGLVDAHRYAKKKNVDLNQLYTGQSRPGSIADQLPKQTAPGPQQGAWDKTKAWWGQRSPWAKAGIGAAAALPIGMGLYAAGGMNPSQPRQPLQYQQQPPIQQY